MEDQIHFEPNSPYQRKGIEERITIPLRSEQEALKIFFTLLLTFGSIHSPKGTGESIRRDRNHRCYT